MLSLVLVDFLVVEFDLVLVGDVFFEEFDELLYLVRVLIIVRVVREVKLREVYCGGYDVIVIFKIEGM